MIWNAPIEKPVEGDLKVVTRFAWFPKRIHDKKVWLEKYQQLWEYTGVPHLMRVGHVIGPTIMVKGWKLIGEKVLRGLPYLDNMPPPPGSNEEDVKSWEEFIKQKKKESFKPK